MGPITVPMRVSCFFYNSLSGALALDLPSELIFRRAVLNKSLSRILVLVEPEKVVDVFCLAPLTGAINVFF